MKPKNLATELAKVLAEQRLSQRALAGRAEVSISGVAHLMNGARPEAATLASLIAQACDDPATRRRLVLAHLRDEVIRSGHDPSEFHLSAASESAHEAALLALAARQPRVGRLLRAAAEAPEMLAALLGLSEVAETYVLPSMDGLFSEAAEAPADRIALPPSPSSEVRYRVPRKRRS